jgi:hypothetical protein
MAWLDENWVYRMPLTIANHSGVAAPECTLTISPQNGKFFENVLSSFNDVRLTAADGVTLLDWAFDGGTPSKTNRTCSFHIASTNHNVSTLYGQAAQSASVGAFLYWGNVESNLASGANNSVNITVNGAKVVKQSLNAPGSSDTTYTLECYSPTPDQQYPRHRIRKQVNDATYIYWDLGGCVGNLPRANQQSLRNEEIAYVQTVIYDQDGNDTTSAMTTLNDIRLLDNSVIEMPIKAGTHEKRYIIIMTIGLVDESGRIRTLDQRATLLVENLGLHPS